MRPVIFLKPICLPKIPYYMPLWLRHVEYPKFSPGDPQQLCFLPPFWMKMLYAGPYNPSDHVVFKVHPQMTTHDVQQYLEKIYNVPVVNVRVKMVYHDLKPNDVPVEKSIRRAVEPFLAPPEPERYEKIAYVRLAPGSTFEFPDLFKSKSPSSVMENLEENPPQTIKEKKDQERQLQERSQPGSTRTEPNGIPPWFT
ncbi:unnamed protein product [Calicophoron daubneyi]|uniref:Large ribosomal subunit protein uL23m n=1 Tax=Calicophoron daubneyi TaxID=300641 RepID=A0AAV2TX54_CALDB